MKKNKISVLLLAALLLSGCTNTEQSAQTEPSDSVTDENSEIPPADDSKAIDIIFKEKRTEYNNSLDLSDYPLTANEADDSFSLVLEAENAALSGGCTARESSGYSGGGYVDGLAGDGDKITFTVELEKSGFYDLCVVCHANDKGRVNNIEIDGKSAGEFIYNGMGEVSECPMQYTRLEAGTHEISITKNWGYIDVDCLKITKSSAVSYSTYSVSPELSNPNADDNTKRLFKFLCDIYGKYSLTGQYADNGILSKEYEEITDETGKSFAVLGMDMMNYSGANAAHGATSKTVEYAYDWYANAGGIVQLCWHWNSPAEYAVDSSEHPWYSSFYKEGTTLDLDKIMNGEDERGYELLMEDIDRISEKLKLLRDSNVPIIWRPLHEASGRWFWWGDCSPESYIKLWNVMYDKMTNEHGLTNLIWMWNAQDENWYPGDDTVDIISWDIYQKPHEYGSCSGTFARAAGCSETSKLVALSENGCVPDPDSVMKDNARWLFWGTWSDPYTLLKGIVLNDEYTETEMLTKAYNSDRTLTLDELPDLKNYPLA